MTICNAKHYGPRRGGGGRDGEKFKKRHVFACLHLLYLMEMASEHKGVLFELN